jgi:hypothetical protein
MAVVASTVVDGGFDFLCDDPRCQFRSLGWDTEAQATARGSEHENEHDTGELMTELTAFEQQVGFQRDEV